MSLKRIFGLSGLFNENFGQNDGISKELFSNSLPILMIKTHYFLCKFMEKAISVSVEFFSIKMPAFYLDNEASRGLAISI